MTKDNTLQQRLKLGDPSAVDELYQLFFAVAQTAAVQVLGDPAMAEDVAQEALWRAWQMAALYDEERGPMARWISRIAHNIAVDYMRSPLVRYPPDSASLPGTDLTMEETYAVTSALNHLHPVERTVLTLRYYEGLSQAEIAVYMRRPLGTVKTWLRAGLAHLREHLEPITSPIAPLPRPTRSSKRKGSMNPKRTELLLKRALEQNGYAVAVSDSNGKFLLYNTAADRLLGIARAEAATPAQSCTERYGLYLTDGETPYREHELPLWRAIAGESIFRRLVLIRNAVWPDGVIVATSARPRLDSDRRIAGGILTCKAVLSNPQSESAARDSP